MNNNQAATLASISASFLKLSMLMLLDLCAGWLPLSEILNAANVDSFLDVEMQIGFLTKTHC